VVVAVDICRHSESLENRTTDRVIWHGYEACGVGQDNVENTREVVRFQNLT
jgi:hypothetical protein